MARITASVYTSHVPAIGAALDLGKTKEDYWKPLFAGYDFSKQWMKDNKPDVVFLDYMSLTQAGGWVPKADLNFNRAARRHDFRSGGSFDFAVSIAYA